MCNRFRAEHGPDKQLIDKLQYRPDDVRDPGPGPISDQFLEFSSIENSKPIDFFRNGDEPDGEQRSESSCQKSCRQYDRKCGRYEYCREQWQDLPQNISDGVNQVGDEKILVRLNRAATNVTQHQHWKQDGDPGKGGRQLSRERIVHCEQVSKQDVARQIKEDAAGDAERQIK